MNPGMRFMGWGIWEIPYMVLFKLGNIMDQYGWKVGMVKQLMVDFLVSDVDTICEMACRIHGKVRLWPSVNSALLTITVAENCICLTTFGGSLMSNFSYICEMLYGIMEKFIWPYINQDLLRINIVEHWNCPTAFSGSQPYQISTRLQNYLWDASKCLYMALCKSGFIMDKYGWKLEFLNNI
jgi:hypothetical protein